MQYLIRHNSRLFFVAALLLFFITACSETSTEQQITAQINTIQDAVSDKSLSDFMELIAKEFKGNKTLNRQDVRRLISYYFLQHRNIDTVKWQADIKVENGIVLVTIHAIVAGSEKVLPDRGKIITINSSWKKIDGTWLIIKADWKDAIVDY